jgi:cyclic beta-1,2-glucan synthetase
VLGSRRSRECTIDSIAQSWAVISSAAEPVRARAAVRAASKALILEEDRLVLLLRPPFDSALHDPGYIRAYPPGVRENGGQYTHAASWLGWALVELGDGAAAEHLFRLLNPLLRAGSPEACARYGVEPYVLAADVYGRPPWIGRGGWTWYTGAAAWTYRLGVEGILGLRREAGRLRVDPCSPPYWGGFEAWVHEGDAELHVIVEDPDGVGKGVVSMSMDGVTLASTGALLEASTPGRHELKVRLGAPVGVLRLPGTTRDQAAKVRPSANPSPGDRTAKPG